MAVLQYCGSKYADADNSLAQQQARVAAARSVTAARRLDGCPPRDLKVSEALAALSRAKTGRAGGKDGAVVEMLRACPWVLKVAIATWFGSRLDGSYVEEVPSWRHLALSGAPKEPGAVPLSKIRWLACTPVCQKWYLRSPVARLQASISMRPGAMTETYGFTGGYSVASVTELTRQALRCAECWGIPLL
eukprot:10718919-Lingulodinium_polyedra.AAC.1